MLHFDTDRRVFHCQVIEIKARTQTDIEGQNALMETMDGQMTNTISVMRHHFDPNNSFLGDRFDREIKNIELRELLRFYINRAYRYNLLTDDDSLEYQRLLDTIDAGFQWQFDKKGIIFDLNGDFGIQTYKRSTDLSFFVVGKRAIRRILILIARLTQSAFPRKKIPFPDSFDYEKGTRYLSCLHQLKYLIF